MQRFANNQPIEFIRFFNRTLVIELGKQIVLTDPPAGKCP